MPILMLLSTLFVLASCSSRDGSVQDNAGVLRPSLTPLIGTWIDASDPEIQIWELKKDGQFLGIGQKKDDEGGCYVVGGQWAIQEKYGTLFIDVQGREATIKGPFSFSDEGKVLEILSGEQRKVLTKSKFSAWVASSELGMCKN